MMSRIGHSNTSTSTVTGSTVTVVQSRREVTYIGIIRITDGAAATVTGRDYFGPTLKERGVEG